MYQTNSGGTLEQELREIRKEKYGYTGTYAERLKARGKKPKTVVSFRRVGRVTPSMTETEYILFDNGYDANCWVAHQESDYKEAENSDYPWPYKLEDIRIKTL